jgi:hypothetical protein
LTAQGAIGANATYIVLQTRLGNGAWVDVAWCSWSGTAGTAVFVLSAGIAGANAFNQARVVGTPPSPALGANQCCLGGVYRFTGKSVITAPGSSSSSAAPSSSSAGAGLPAKVLVTIRAKVLGLK